MIDKYLTKYLLLSEKVRNGYIQSLGVAHSDWKEKMSFLSDKIPEMIIAFYSQVEGTYEIIEKNEYLDFIPMYRLIHIDELEKEYCTLINMLKEEGIEKKKLGIEVIVPFLADVSNAYICYARTFDQKEQIVFYYPTEGLHIMHDNIEAFFQTHIACLESGAYYLDEDGYLEFDIKKEHEIGKRYNLNVDYWKK